jgi:hypothetical protein
VILGIGKDIHCIDMRQRRRRCKRQIPSPFPVGSHSAVMTWRPLEHYQLAFLQASSLLSIHSSFSNSLSDFSASNAMTDLTSKWRVMTNDPYGVVCHHSLQERPYPTVKFSQGAGSTNQQVTYFCLDCVKPHASLSCNGISTRTYKKCWVHDNNKSVKSNITLTDPRSLEADQIRATIGDELMAYIWGGNCRGDSTSLMKHMKVTLLKHCILLMLKPEKFHVNRCLHSNSPEMIISHTGNQGNEAACISKLATDLYFKRCDGTFKNVVGEKLKA